MDENIHAGNYGSDEVHSRAAAHSGASPGLTAVGFAAAAVALLREPTFGPVCGHMAH